MKSKIALILCISTLTITAAGCANNAKDTNQTEHVSETVEPVTAIPFDTDADDIVEEHPDLSKSKFRETAIRYYNLSKAEADAMYQKIEDSKILEKENIKITGAALNDYDGNGQTDMLICLYEEKENGDSYADGCLYLFMNDDTPYYIYDDFCCYSFGGIFSDFGADIDRDGYTEIVFCVQGTGCGGAGDCQKFVLKYKDNKVLRMKLPDDFPSEYNYDSGLSVEVKRDSENNVYNISCPYLGETISINYADDDNENDFGEGANCRGYFTLEMTEYEGEQFLTGYEYLYAGSIAGGVGNAVFLFDWDENGKAFVKDWYVEDWDGNRYVPADRTQKPESNIPQTIFDKNETGAEVTAYEEFLTGKRTAGVGARGEK